MFLSIVITNFNRKQLVCRSIQSCIEEFANFNNFEIIVIDDASTDGSYEYLIEKYDSLIKKNVLIVNKLEVNLGVTGAKNSGFILANGKWVMFLDSDDYLLKSSGVPIYSELASAENYSIVFFRCIDHENKFVGTQFDHPLEINIKTYMEKSSFGEALTVFRKYNINQAGPYESKLRGYEGIGCARYILAYAPALLSTVAARIYDKSSTDRLSISRNFLKRIHLIGIGHYIYLKEFNGYMVAKTKLYYLIKSMSYIIVGYSYKLFGK